MQYTSEPLWGEIDAFKRLLIILYFALLATVPMYWFVAELVAANREPGNLGVLRLALLAVAAGTAAAVLFLRFSLIPPLLHNPTTELTDRLARLRAFYVVCFALSEAVALYGLTLRILGGTHDDALIFYGVSVGLFLLCYPKVPQMSGSGPMS